MLFAVELLERDVVEMSCENLIMYFFVFFCAKVD